MNAGSSPRVRGKRYRRCQMCEWFGLIPARAGKTRCPQPGPGSAGAHPRACGENVEVECLAENAGGSSPRVRGKRRRCDHHQHRRGLIPARAGKTLVVNHPDFPDRAHPRACGENLMMSRSAVPTFGSSPRVRGKPDPVLEHVRPRRLIPARAGKTASSPRIVRPRRAHPRACGENISSRASIWSVCGSSPRVRGKPSRAPDRPGTLRLIPARAGKTPATPPAASSPGAHPRACGENGPLPAEGMTLEGSSPRVRGKREGDGEGCGADGLIPARAGKTSSMVMIPVCRAAHPRACGENTARAPGLIATSGSSPRVRGKLPAPRIRLPEAGLIPARAGKTRDVCRSE